MSWCRTCVITAEVINLSVIRDRPGEQLVHEPVNIDSLAAAIADAPVAGGLAARPQQAPSLLLDDQPGEQPFAQWLPRVHASSHQSPSSLAPHPTAAPNTRPAPRPLAPTPP